MAECRCVSAPATLGWLQEPTGSGRTPHADLTAAAAVADAVRLAAAVAA